MAGDSERSAARMQRFLDVGIGGDAPDVRQHLERGDRQQHAYSSAVEKAQASTRLAA